MKKIYTVDHYVPFPSSEYGGLWVVIANNNDECFDLIVDYDGSAEYNQQYFARLKENVLKARVFNISDDVKSQVVESFTT
jgi:hypothetical protein